MFIKNKTTTNRISIIFVAFIVLYLINVNVNENDVFLILLLFKKKNYTILTFL